MKIQTVALLLLLTAGFGSCRKEDALGSVDNIPGLGGDTWVKGPIDKWIYDSLTVPYNANVKYKYDQFELALNRTLVPMREEKVLPILSAFKRVWINPYVDEAGINFFKKYGIKFFVLVGSGSYDPNSSTVNLGSTAEDGTRTVLYQLNYFNTVATPGYKKSDSAVVKEVLKTIEHEFAHVLHRNVIYPFAFTQVGSKYYTSDWNNVDLSDALAEGYVSSYAMSKADDDFAETVSYMLIDGKAGFDALVEGIKYTGTTANGTTADVARGRLREKEAIIVAYFRSAWNVDFYNLQTRTRTAMLSLL